MADFSQKYDETGAQAGSSGQQEDIQFGASGAGGAAPSGGSGAAIELEHAIGFNGSVPSGLWAHPNGKDFVYPAGGCLVVCDYNDPHNQVFLRGHDDNLSAVALSRGGSLAATGQVGLNSDVVVWRYGEGELKSALYRFSEHDHGISCLAFSQDERLLVTVGNNDDGKLFVWDLATGNIVTTAKAPQGTNAIAFGGMFKNVKRRPTGEYQFVTAGQQTLCHWILEPQSGKLSCIKVPSRVQRNYTSVAWSDDFELVVLGSKSGDFAFCAFLDKRSLSLCDCVDATSGGVNAICSDGNFLDGTVRVIVGGGDGTIVVFTRDSQGFIETAKAKVEGSVTSLCLSADRAEVVAGTAAGNAYRLTTASLNTLLLCETHAAAVTDVAYAPKVSERFCTASADGTLRIWDASDYTVVVRALVVDGGVPNCVALSLDTIISGWSDGKVRCHSAEDGSWLWNIPNAHAGGVHALQLSANQRFIISGGEQGEVRVWELRSRELVSHLKEHTMRVTSIALFDDDVHALTCSRDRSFLCWDLRREKRISNHTQRMGGINSIVLSRDQTQVITAGQERKLTYWDLRRPKPMQVVDHQPGEGTCIAVSYTGQFLATAGADQVVRLWDYATGELLQKGIGHSSVVRKCAFSPDDRQLVSVGEDGCVFVWNLYA